MLNRALLVLAGLFEVGFTICLGKAREEGVQHPAGWLTGFIS